MQGAVLIHGANQEKRQRYIKNNFPLGENNPDSLIIDLEKGKSSIGIDRARDVIKFLSEKPISQNTKTVWIKNAHRLTEQAQNALLKTLEEAPEFATIILESKNEKSLLDTVVSRCQKIALRSEDEVIDNQEIYESFEEKSRGEMFDLAEKYSKEEREFVIAFLQGLMSYERKRLLDTSGDLGANNTESTAKRNRALKGELVMETIEDLENTNVNLRLALERLFVRL